MFKIGDIVVGNKQASEVYGITKEGCSLIVTEVKDKIRFTGRVIYHPAGNNCLGIEFWLRQEYFELQDNGIKENE